MATLAAWELGMAIAGTATAYSTYHQGQVASAEHKYQAQTEQRNALIAQQQGQAAAEAQNRRMRMALGSQQAAYGASGVSGDIGSPVDVFASSVQQGTLDNLTLKYNAKLRGMGYQSSAALDSAAASNASTSGMLNAAGTALGGASRAYTQSGGGGDGIPVVPNSGVRQGLTAEDSNPTFNTTFTF